MFRDDCLVLVGCSGVIAKSGVVRQKCHRTLGEDLRDPQRFATSSGVNSGHLLTGAVERPDTPRCFAPMTRVPLHRVITLGSDAVSMLSEAGRTRYRRHRATRRKRRAETRYPAVANLFWIVATAAVRRNRVDAVSPIECDFEVTRRFCCVGFYLALRKIQNHVRLNSRLSSPLCYCSDVDTLGFDWGVSVRWR